MKVQELDGKKLAQMIQQGAQHLMNNAEQIDALNVFPVPDGDTGTNMNLSMTSGANEVKKVPENDVSKVAEAFSKGLLMGARGNSGVILSQLFRGFSKGMAHKTTLTSKDLAEALDNGVQTAYKAVMKPVEGTILTVASDAAKAAQQAAETEADISVFMEMILDEARNSLKRTPELLPILKEVGVVDSGGQGLVTIYEGFSAVLKGEELPGQVVTEEDMDEMINAEHHKIAQDFMDTSEIEYGYCTEFMVEFENDKLSENPYEENSFRDELSRHGDSLLVVSDEDVVKVHVHTEYPGDVLTLGQRYGSLINMKIENMRKQHTSLVGGSVDGESTAREKDAFAVICVVMGTGIKNLFESLGASGIIEGGQTMNPSTQDITEAIDNVHAENIIILPNNKNIVMAAEQAADIAEDNVAVVPCKTIPQGISAMLSFNPEESLDANKAAMTTAKDEVKTGEVTYAIRDSKIDGFSIEEGHYMGIADGTIKASDSNLAETVKTLVDEMVDEDDELLTIIYGEDVTESEADELASYAEDNHEELEVEVHDGGQAIYNYILSVE